MGTAVECDSAGTAGHHVGEAPHRSTLAVLREHGIASAHRARRVNADDFRRFDLVLAMDNANLVDLRAMAPSNATAELALFRSYAPDAPLGAEVPDPWGFPMEHFREVYTLCQTASRGLLQALEGAHDPAQRRFPASTLECAGKRERPRS